MRILVVFVILSIARFAKFYVAFFLNAVYNNAIKS